MAKTLKKIRRELLQDEVKHNVLKRLGHLEKVKEEGWDSLSSRECGRIGGLIRKEKNSVSYSLSQEKIKIKRNNNKI